MARKISISAFLKKAFKKYLPEVDVIIRKDSPHCGYFAGNTAAYVTELEAFIK